MTNLETNTRARRVEPLVLERWVPVRDDGSIVENVIGESVHYVHGWIGPDRPHLTARKVKLTIEAVE